MDNYLGLNDMKSVLLYILLFLFMPLTVFADTWQVDRIVVEGSQRLDQAAVLSAISAQEKSAVTTEKIDSDLAAIFKLGHFDDVTAEIIEKDGETLLVFRLVERPLVRKVKFEGNEEISRSKLSPLVTITIPSIYNPKVAAETIEAIKAAYVEKGFHAATIESVLDVNNRNEATVTTFVIEEGSKVLIDKISFEGNTVFSDRQLRKKIQTKERTFMSWLTDTGAYNEELLQTDLEIIKDMYFDEGYVQVNVKQPYVTLVEGNKYLEIFIQIVEGDHSSMSERSASRGT